MRSLTNYEEIKFQNVNVCKISLKDFDGMFVYKIGDQFNLLVIFREPYVKNVILKYKIRFLNQYIFIIFHMTSILPYTRFIFFSKHIEEKLHIKFKDTICFISE